MSTARRRLAALSGCALLGAGLLVAVVEVDGGSAPTRSDVRALPAAAPAAPAGGRATAEEVADRPVVLPTAVEVAVAEQGRRVRLAAQHSSGDRAGSLEEAAPPEQAVDPRGVAAPVPGEAVAVVVDPVSGAPDYVEVTGVDTADAVERASRVDGVVAVDLVARTRASGAVAVGAAQDPDRYRQWAHDRLRLDDLDVDVRGLVIAVLDSGVSAAHEDLAGVVDCASGWDFVDDDADACHDPHGHGSHVAGIAASPRDDVGMRGVAAGATVLPVRVLDTSGAGLASDAAAGIRWAVDHGADVVNLSLGGPAGRTTYQPAVDYARARGVVVVAAAGNKGAGENPVEYPASNTSVISVGATERDDSPAPFTTWNDFVDVAAPGVGVLGPWLPTGRVAVSGTSMASPVVAGAVAVALASGADPSTMEQTVRDTATDVHTPGFDRHTGHGLVDVAALAGAAPRPPRPPRARRPARARRPPPARRPRRPRRPVRRRAPLPPRRARRRRPRRPAPRRRRPRRPSGSPSRCASATTPGCSTGRPPCAPTTGAPRWSCARRPCRRGRRWRRCRS